MAQARIAPLRRELRAAADADRAANLRRYFKTGPGEYAEGDRFLGLRVPQARAVARRYHDLPFADVSKLLRSRWHEERLVALLLLVDRFRRGDERERERVFSFYLRNTRHVDNWDLVDLSAPHIVGARLAELDPGERTCLDRLARSDNLWERRIAVIATAAFIRDHQFDDTFRIAEILLRDEHDLIHKAVGWMLREVGNRDRPAEAKFLDRHHRRMPRTMLRYAIEKFPERERRRYLAR